MNVLLIGGTGTVGKQVLSYLDGRGHKIRVLTTSEEKAGTLPKGVEGFLGDLNNDTAAGAFKDVEVVFLLTAHSQQEIQQGQKAVSLAKQAGVRKIIFQSIHHAYLAPSVEHFHSKVVIAQAVKDSGLEYVLISPNNFYQNDLIFKDALIGYQLYIQPIGSVGLNRVDVRDIAQAVLTVIESDRYNGQEIALAGPVNLTAEQTVIELGKHLGYTVKYAGDDLEAFKSAMYPYVPKWMVDDWATMFDFFQQHGLTATDEELQVLREVLGRSPISYEQFLKEHVQYLTA